MKRAILVLAASAAIATATAPRVSGHETRTAGAITLTAGWGSEPVYAGFVNSVQLRVAQGGQPVNDIPAGAVKVEVTSGGETSSLSMQPAFRVGVFGELGDYRAYLIPTRAGSYTFKFTGSIHNQTIDQSFTSGETTFDSAGDPSAIQFPERAASAQEIADRLEQEVLRLTQANTRLASALDKAKDEASAAKLLGYVGVGAGALGVMLSIAGFSPRKRRAVG
ncbi:MAG: hypothetical protein ACRDJM_05920 [Actinomycetota bacterium]